MRKVAYFGTLGGGVCGHYPKVISGNFTDKELRDINKIDCDYTLRLFDGETKFLFFLYGPYTCFGMNASPDDKRGGCMTIVLFEGKAEEKEILNIIHETPFLKNQFDRLVKLKCISMPNIE